MPKTVVLHFANNCSLNINRYVGREVHNHVYGVGKGRIWLDNVQCSGTEKSIFECSHSGMGINNCGHSEDVAISCVSDSTGITLPFQSVRKKR